MIDRKDDFFAIIDGISQRISQQNGSLPSQFSRIPPYLSCSILQLSRDVFRTKLIMSSTDTTSQSDMSQGGSERQRFKVIG